MGRGRYQGARSGFPPRRDILFLSHANPEDDQVTSWLALQLAREGYAVWCDLTKLLGGEAFWDDIQAAIERRTAKFLYVLSRNSNSKDGPLAELTVARDVEKKLQLRDFIIPLHIDDLPHNEMHILLRRLNTIPFRKSWAAGLNQLVQKLRKQKVPTKRTFGPKAVSEWWESHFSAETGIQRWIEEILSNYFATEYKPIEEATNWEQFKTFVNGLEHRRYVFRGQRKPLRLHTGFHRTGRADLQRFLNEDIRTLHRHLSQRTSHVFDLNIPDQNGAFFNLVQHHGYPTPLLDWTYSPYVGAFFAYRHVKNSEAAAASENDKVRIFVFDQKQWRTDWPQLSKLTPCRPHFSILEFIAIDNERLIPQQSVSSVTNIDDIETYIRSMEKGGKQYLRIIDLPLRQRAGVMRELSVMGITAGSLFPGLDGACEELRERFFDL